MCLETEEVVMVMAPTLDEVRITAAYRSLLAARATTGRCPSAQNIAAERQAEANLNAYLERFPRKETLC